LSVTVVLHFIALFQKDELVRTPKPQLEGFRTEL